MSPEGRGGGVGKCGSWEMERGCFLKFPLFYFLKKKNYLAALVAQMVKNLPAMQIPGSGRSPGEGNGNPLQYSCLENSMDRAH